MSIIISPIIQIRTLRPGGDLTAGEQQSRNSNPGPSGCEPLIDMVLKYKTWQENIGNFYRAFAVSSAQGGRGKTVWVPHLLVTCPQSVDMGPFYG